MWIFLVLSFHSHLKEWTHPEFVIFNFLQCVRGIVVATAVRQQPWQVKRNIPVAEKFQKSAAENKFRIDSQFRFVHRKWFSSLTQLKKCPWTSAGRPSVLPAVDRAGTRGTRPRRPVWRRCPWWNVPERCSRSSDDSCQKNNWNPPGHPENGAKIAVNQRKSENPSNLLLTSGNEVGLKLAKSVR